MRALGVTCSLRPPATTLLRQPTTQSPVANLPTGSMNVAPSPSAGKGASKGRISSKSRGSLGQLRPAAVAALSDEDPMAPGRGSWISPFLRMMSRAGSVKAIETPDRNSGKQQTPGMVLSLSSLHPCIFPYPVTIYPMTGNRSWANGLYPRSLAMSRDGGLAASIDASGGAGGSIGLAVGGVVSGGGLKSSSNHGYGGGSAIRTSPTTFKHFLIDISSHILSSHHILHHVSHHPLDGFAGGIILEEDENADKLSIGSFATPRPSFKASILQAIGGILSHLLREQRGVVVVVEDAHEMDEESWKVLLSLIQRKDAWTYSLIVLTHESTDNLTQATLASTKALGLTRSEPSNAAANLRNVAIPLPTSRGGRANTTASTSFHNTAFLRLSYESTLDSLKQLKIGSSMPLPYPAPY